MSAAPLVRLPVVALVWLEGRLSTAVVRTPLASILEMREPGTLPVYGPTGGMTCSQQRSVESAPPIPPSAPYMLPYGPTFRPRRVFNSVAKPATWFTASRTAALAPAFL